MNNKKYDVFISYQQDIVELVEKIDTELEKRGIMCFRDKKSIMWGDNILKKINEGLKVANLYLLFINDKFLESSWTQQEETAALNLYLKSINNKRVMSILLDKEAERYWESEPLQGVIKAYKWDGRISEMIDEFEDVLNDLQ